MSRCGANRELGLCLCKRIVICRYVETVSLVPDRQTRHRSENIRGGGGLISTGFNPDYTSQISLVLTDLFAS
jgi:hypothetical protein